MPYLIEIWKEGGSQKLVLAFLVGLFKENNPKETFRLSFLSDEVDGNVSKKKKIGDQCGAIFSLK